MSLQSFIIIFVATIFTGVLSVVLAKAKIRKECKDFDSFVEHVAGFVSPKASRKSVSMHINYILANYQELSTIVGESVYAAPISRFGAALANGNPIDPSMYTRIAASRIEFGGAKDKENARLTKQLFNPFILLYRGVELVMVFIFGYIISRFYPGFDRDTNIVWKVGITLITVLGSIASIISFLMQN